MTHIVAVQACARTKRSVPKNDLFHQLFEVMSANVCTRAKRPMQHCPWLHLLACMLAVGCIYFSHPMAPLHCTACSAEANCNSNLYTTKEPLFGACRLEGVTEGLHRRLGSLDHGRLLYLCRHRVQPASAEASKWSQDASHKQTS